MKSVMVISASLLTASFAFAAPQAKLKQQKVAQASSESQTQTQSQSISTQPTTARSTTLPLEAVNFTTGYTSSSVSNVNTDGSILNTGRRAGFTLGVSTDVTTGIAGLSFEPGVAYRQGGIHFDSDVNDSFNGNIELNYIAIPLVAKYSMAASDTVSIYGKAGLAPAFAVTKKISVANGSDDQSQSISDGTNSFDVAAIVGIGTKVMLTQELDLILEGSYWKGLRDVASDNNFDSAHNNSLGLSAGVAVKL